MLHSFAINRDTACCLRCFSPAACADREALCKRLGQCRAERDCNASTSTKFKQNICPLILLKKCFPREATTVTKSMLRLYGDPKPRLPSECLVNLYCYVLQWRPFPE